MKRIIGIAALIAMLATMLTACGSFKCDICQQEKSGGKNTLELLGEEVVCCDDCYDEIDKGMDALGDLF